jgi:hypothetical protein
MNKDYYRRDTCRLCNQKKLEDVIELSPTPPGNNFLSEEQLQTPESFYPLVVRFCKNCSHVQLADVVDPKILYQDDYKYVSGTAPVFVEHFRQYAKDVLAEYAIPAGTLVADIGSNDGTCLRFFKEAGHNVLGVDPAIEIATKATEQGIPTIATFFSESLGQRLLKEYGPAYLITSHNACAHIDDLIGIMRGVQHWLADDGLFIFEVGYLLDVYRNTWFDTMYHEHLDYHSVKPLIPFFGSLEMELLSVKRISPQGGSIRVCVQKKGGRRRADASVDELVRLEEEMGLDKVETFRTFNGKINTVKQELSGMLRSLKIQGKSIAGYGAPTKSTTLLTYFGLGKDIIDYIVDDNPLKQGKYTPGLHIPIMVVEELYKRMPDYLVVLSWNFAEPIMAKHQEYKDRGGKFILPMPKARIVE